LVTINEKQGHHYPCFVFNEFVDLKKSDMGYFFKFYIDFSKGIYAEKGKKIESIYLLFSDCYVDLLKFGKSAVLPKNSKIMFKENRQRIINY
jgi:hypothetical protein